MSPPGLEVACGLNPYLNQFALDRGALPYWKWAQAGITQQPTVPRNMHKVFEETAQKALAGVVSRIHFNLESIDDPVASADVAAQGLVHRQALGLPVDWSTVGLTNAELDTIRNDPQLLALTTFYRDGVPVPSPF